MHLNGISFEQLRDTTWFVDDPAVQFKYATHFKDVVWRNAITVTVFQVYLCHAELWIHTNPNKLSMVMFLCLGTCEQCSFGGDQRQVSEPIKISTNNSTDIIQRLCAFC